MLLIFTWGHKRRILCPWHRMTPCACGASSWMLMVDWAYFTLFWVFGAGGGHTYKLLCLQCERVVAPDETARQIDARVGHPVPYRIRFGLLAAGVLIVMAIVVGGAMSGGGSSSPGSSPPSQSSSTMVEDVWIVGLLALVAALIGVGTRSAYRGPGEAVPIPATPPPPGFAPPPGADLPPVPIAPPLAPAGPVEPRATIQDDASTLGASAAREDELVGELLEEIVDASETDPSWWFRDGSELVWVSGPTAPRFRAGEELSRNGRRVRRVQVTTELLQELEPDHPVVAMLGPLARNASSSALVYDPGSGELSACSSWLVPADGSRGIDVATIVGIAFLQAWEAGARLPGFESVPGVTKVRRAHPRLGARNDVDPAFARAIAAIADIGRRPSAFAGAPLHRLLDAHPATFVVTHGDATHVVANVEYAAPADERGDDTPSTARCVFATDERHPTFGSGLVVTTKLPTNLGDEELSLLAAGLNRAEALEPIRFASVGSWCATPDGSGDLAHVQFWPSAIASAELVPAIASDLAHRCLWAGPRIARSTLLGQH